MATGNVDLVRRVFEAVISGDLDAAQALMAPDIVIVQPPEVPDAKAYEGSQAVRRAWEDWPSQWEDFRMELVEAIELDAETVLARTHQGGRGHDSGIEVSFDVFFVSRIRGGLTARMEMFFTREQALAAARG